MDSARHMPKAATSMITAKGNALATLIVCSACSPPATSSTAATSPCSTAQNTRCHTGVAAAPPEASESITSAPESDDVTKKVTISTTVRKDVTADNGRCSNSLNSAIAVSACTASMSAVYPWTMIRCSAVSPKIENHRKVNSVGTSITPTMNSRIVRPRLILAMNRPTNGAHAMVQPKMNSVQLPIQSLRE